jgi:hypothetical protein
MKRIPLLLLLVPLAAFPQAPRTLRLAFLGDIMAHSVNYRVADYHDIYAGIGDILAGSDLSFANLEFPVDAARAVSDYPAFNGSRAYWQAAVDAGIGVFSLANNHALDQGVEGIRQTLGSAAAVRTPSGGPIRFSGIRTNLRLPFAPELIVVRGVRIGFLAVTQFLNTGGANPFVDVADYEDPAAEARLLALVASASRACDIFILSYHGDREYSPRASPGKVRFFRRLLASGATIVYGHHPHVFQGYEVVREGGESRVALLSMGNLISGMTWRADPADPQAVNPATGDSAVLLVDVLVTGAGSSVTGVRAVPVSDYRNAMGEMVVGKTEDLARSASGLPAPWVRWFRARLEANDQLMRPLGEGP